MGRTSSAVKDRYNAKVYDEIKVRVAKGQKTVLQSIASSYSESLNGFISNAIDERVVRLQGTQNAAQAPETPQIGDLILRELGYDPKAEKPLYVEKNTGKQYYVVPVPNDTQPGEYSENNVPF